MKSNFFKYVSKLTLHFLGFTQLSASAMDLPNKDSNNVLPVVIIGKCAMPEVVCGLFFVLFF